LFICVDYIYIYGDLQTAGQRCLEISEQDMDMETQSCVYIYIHGSRKLQRKRTHSCCLGNAAKGYIYMEHGISGQHAAAGSPFTTC